MRLSSLLALTWISMKEAHVLKLSINRAWQSMNFDLTGKFKMNAAY